MICHHSSTNLYKILAKLFVHFLIFVVVFTVCNKLTFFWYDDILHEHYILGPLTHPGPMFPDQPPTRAQPQRTASTSLS